MVARRHSAASSATFLSGGSRASGVLTVLVWQAHGRVVGCDEGVRGKPEEAVAVACQAVLEDGLGTWG